MTVAALRLAAAALLLGLGACGLPVNDYTAAEADTRLAVTDASHRVTVRFIRGSDRLAPGEARRLHDMIARGEIDGRDRVLVSPSGAPGIAERRFAALHREFLHDGIVVAAQPLADVPRDAALIEVGRYLVTLPRCPNWSKPAAADFTNMPLSNDGCATASNLSLMVANPADLAGGRPLSPGDGKPAAAAVERYLADKVQLPAVNTALPIPAAATAAPGAAGGNNPTPGS